MIKLQKKSLIIIGVVIAVGILMFNLTSNDSKQFRPKQVAGQKQKDVSLEDHPEIKSFIENTAASVTQTKIQVADVKGSKQSGKAVINRILVTASPQGFSSVNLINAPRTIIEFDPASLDSKGPVIIRRMVVTKPKINFEGKTGGKTNFDELLSKAQAYKDSASGGRKMIIEKLVIHNAEVNIKHDLLKNKKLSTQLPPVRVADLGKNTNGVTAGEVMKQIITTLSKSTVVASNNRVLKELAPAKDPSMDEAGKEAYKKQVDAIRKSLGMPVQ